MALALSAAQVTPDESKMSRRAARGWAQPGYPGNVVSEDLLFRRDLRNIELKLAEQRASTSSSSGRWGTWITLAAVLGMLAVFVGGAGLAVVVLGGFVDLETFGRPQGTVDAIMTARATHAHWKAAGPSPFALWTLALHNSKPLVVQGTAQYQAGLPTFPRVFARDSIMSAFLLDSPKMIRAITTLCARTIGMASNPVTGEEPGKVPNSRVIGCDGAAGVSRAPRCPTRCEAALQDRL